MTLPTSAQLASAIQQALAAYPDVAALDFSCLRATGMVVTESPPGSAVLSTAILDACFPRASPSQDYFHYTTFSAFAGILAESECRLYWLKKRLHEHEYAPFCDAHGLDGYTTPDPDTGAVLLDDLCRDLFYLSVTVDPENRTLWHAFSEGGSGVRIKLRLTPTLERSQLRHIRYLNTSKKTIIRIIQDAVTDRFGLRFVLGGPSRAPAFSLPMFLEDENETRLLVKRFSMPPGEFNPWSSVRSEGAHQFLPLPICRDNDFCRVDVCSVAVGDPHNAERARQLLDRSPWCQTVPVEMANF